MNTHTSHPNFELFAVLMRCFAFEAQLSESRLRDLFAAQKALTERFGNCLVQRTKLLKDALLWAKRAHFVSGCEEGVWSITADGELKGHSLLRSNACPFKYPRYLRSEWCAMVWPKSSQPSTTH